MNLLSVLPYTNETHPYLSYINTRNGDNEFIRRLNFEVTTPYNSYNRDQYFIKIILIGYYEPASQFYADPLDFDYPHYCENPWYKYNQFNIGLGQITITPSESDRNDNTPRIVSFTMEYNQISTEFD